MKDLKAVYKAPTEDFALTNLGVFEEKWSKKISNVCKLLEKQLDRIIDIF